MDRIKPVYLYIIGGILGGISSFFRSSPTINYTFVFLGLAFMIWGIVKHFREK
jgi:phage shock protein PspC (stress-responsive transcriptional regulator)